MLMYPSRNYELQRVNKQLIGYQVHGLHKMHVIQCIKLEEINQMISPSIIQHLILLPSILVQYLHRHHCSKVKVKQSNNYNNNNNNNNSIVTSVVITISIKVLNVIQVCLVHPFMAMMMLVITA